MQKILINDRCGYENVYVRKSSSEGTILRKGDEETYEKLIKSSEKKQRRSETEVESKISRLRNIE